MKPATVAWVMICDNTLEQSIYKTATGAKFNGGDGHFAASRRFNFAWAASSPSRFILDIHSLRCAFPYWHLDSVREIPSIDRRGLKSRAHISTYGVWPRVMVNNYGHRISVRTLLKYLDNNLISDSPQPVHHRPRATFRRLDTCPKNSVYNSSLRCNLKTE